MRKANNSWAVSEVIGFFLILGIMVTGIGLITLYGYPILLEQQNNANVRNMERNMIVLQADINALAYKSVPYKETTMQVGGSSIIVNPSPVSPTSNDAGFIISDGTKTISFYPGDIRYELGDAIISLENGAVHKRYWSDQTGSVMLSDPRWYIDDNPITGNRVLVIDLINVTTESTNGIPQPLSKIGISTIRSHVNSTTNEPWPPLTGQPITIKYQNNPEYNFKYAWKDYFEKLAEQYNDPSGYGAVSVIGGDTLKVEGVDQLIIKKYEVTILGM